MKLLQPHTNALFKTMMGVMCISTAMASGKQNYTMKNWMEDGMSDHSVSVMGKGSSSSVRPPATPRVEVIDEKTPYDEFDESVSTMDYGAVQARLIDDPEIRGFIKRMYLQITPDNYELLSGHAQGFVKKGMFQRFDGGVWIKAAGRQFTDEPLLSLVSAMHRVTKYRISLTDAYRIDAAVDVIAETICGFNYLKEINLSSCGLADAHFREILDSITSTAVEVLNITDNRLTADILPMIQRKFKKLQDLQADFDTSSTAVAVGQSMQDMKISSDRPVVKSSVGLKEDMAIKQERDRIAAEKATVEQERQALEQLRSEIAAKEKGDAEREKLSAEQAKLEKQKKELADQRRVLEEQQRQVIERPRAQQAVPSFARGYEDVYNRFINGKLIFDNEKGQRREFDIRQFANTLEGEFDLSGLTFADQYDNNKMKPVSDHLRIKVGVRLRMENESKVTVWLTPKFLLDSISSHPWKTVDWKSPMGIMWTYGNFDMDSFDYLTSQQFDEISSQNLLKLALRAVGHGVGVGRRVFPAFSLNFN